MVVLNQYTMTIFQKNPSEICAIKCIKKAGLNKGSTENLLREIKILKQIKHEHIVQLKDFQVYLNYNLLIKSKVAIF